MFIVREKRSRTVATAARVQAMDSLTVTALPQLGDTSEVIPSSLDLVILRVVPSVVVDLVVSIALLVVHPGVVCVLLVV